MRLVQFIGHARVQQAIIALIVLNAITLGLETSQRAMDAAGGLLVAVDRTILAVFVAEILIKLVAYGRGFWRDPWNLFDTLVIGLALAPATGNLSVLRALRVLRVLRLVSVIPSMRRVVSALMSALPGMGSIIALLALIFYVFSVMATKLFGASFPEWFGTIGRSAYSLFQIMTLESWSMGIVRPVMETHPFAWAFFVPFILITSFAVLNLFIGIIVDAMQSQHREESAGIREAAHEDATEIIHEIRALRSEVQKLSQHRQSPE
ncbi:MAG: ion transporter [Rhodovibrionaceae bacterium]|nr:ion transporter [Rhodovibrionaceae bacterium]